MAKKSPFPRTLASALESFAMAWGGPPSGLPFAPKRLSGYELVRLDYLSHRSGPAALAQPLREREVSRAHFYVRPPRRDARNHLVSLGKLPDILTPNKSRRALWQLFSVARTVGLRLEMKLFYHGHGMPTASSGFSS